MELYVYDLVMFKNKKTLSIFLETIHTMVNIKGIHICETDNFRFDESNLKVIQEDFNYLVDWYKFYNDNIEIIGIWRFNIITKNYKAVYYNGTSITNEELKNEH